MNLTLEERKDPGLWVGGAEGLAEVGEWQGPSNGWFGPIQRCREDG